MNKKMLSAWLAGICLVGAMSSARAEMAYTQVGGGSVMQNPDHIDFALMFNNTIDNSNGVKDGVGIWIGYRHSLIDIFSIGGKLGIHQFWIKNGGSKDQVTSIPLMFTAQVENNFDHAFNLFAQLGLGPCFNSIHGDATDAFNLTLGTSIAFDFAFGGTFEINPNFAVGVTLDWFISSASVNTRGPFGDNNLDISHFGIGILFVGSF